MRVGEIPSVTGATGKAGLRDDLDPVPEGHVPGDLFRRLLGGRVVPRRVGVDRAAYVERVIARLALPAAVSVRRARGEELPADRRWREVVVPLDHDGRVALGHHLAVPDRFHG